MKVDLIKAHIYRMSVKKKWQEQIPKMAQQREGRMKEGLKTKVGKNSTP